MKTYKVTDGSYALANVEGKMKPLSGIALAKKEFLILADGCDLPADGPFGVTPERNNVILIEIDTREIVFTQRRFLREIKYCPHCGHLIEKEN